MATYPRSETGRLYSAQEWRGLLVFIVGFLLIVAAAVLSCLAYGIGIGIAALFKGRRRPSARPGDHPLSLPSR